MATMTWELWRIIHTDGTIELQSDEPTLEALQRAVGGYIERVPVTHTDLVMFCNEEGLLMQLPYNYEASELVGRDIVGNVAVVRARDVQ